MKIRTKKLNAKAKKAPSEETQESLIEQAVQYEELAERWFHSDIVKALRFYVEASKSYERGFRAVPSTPENCYNIWYNQTRLLLKIYSEYSAANGYIDLLAYVNVSSIPEVSSVVKPLEAIIELFEKAVEMFPSLCGWDLYFHMLIALQSLCESSDSATGDKLVHTCENFTKYSSKLLHIQLEFLDGSAGAEPAPSADQIGCPSTGQGVSTAKPDLVQTEVVESSESITPETLAETLVLGFNFVATLQETLLEARGPADASLTSIQANYLEEVVEKLYVQLRNIDGEYRHLMSADRAEIEHVLKRIDGLRVVAAADLQGIEQFVSAADATVLDTHLLLIDLLQTAFPVVDPAHHWRLSCLLAQTLKTCQDLLAARRSEIMNAKASQLFQLSATVFQLCDVILNRCDNEVRRLYLKNMQAANAPPSEERDREMNLLLTNAKTLATNALQISKQSCGYCEYVTDKLKRNYIYNESRLRSEVLLGTVKPPNPRLEDLLATYTYYSVLMPSSLV